jgi:carboxypeptidase Taq
MSAYLELCRQAKRHHNLRHLLTFAAIDRATVMPPKGGEARAEAMAELEGMLHRESRDPAMADLLRAAEAEPLDAAERANLREIQRGHRLALAVPDSLVESRVRATARCEAGWQLQRPANDWQGFLENFREVVRLARSEARHLADASGLAPYDAMLDLYEPGVRSAELDLLFGDLRGWLPGLVQKVRDRQSSERVLAPAGPFTAEAQRALNRAVMERLGFDFEAGRLDTAVHPFCGGVQDDIRVTTRYREADFLHSLYATIHETGHARYEQGLPREWPGQPIALPRSMGIHESQSLAFELQLGLRKSFVEFLAPLIASHFGPQDAFEPENLHRHLTRVAPDKIRVDADELCYPAHVMLRYTIERALIEGEIEPEDIPALWDEQMRDLLGVDTRGDYRDGCLQDTHWAEGVFGYFPCYTLGAIYAAQWFACIQREAPELDSRIVSGDFSAVVGWLDRAIWSQGSRWETRELVTRASGEPINPAHFRAHLEARYLG